MSSSSALPTALTAEPPSQAIPWLPRFAWAVVVYNVGVILWGTLVRATGSGAGCGDHWPLCNGVLLQTHPRMATIIELTHRMTSGITVIAVLLLALWTFRATTRGHLARMGAIAAVVLTFNEALLGALLVLLRLTADNKSGERGVYLSLHLANTLLLLGVLALSAHFLSRGRDCRRAAVRFKHLRPALLGLAALLCVGVSGSLAALGDTLFPTGSLLTALSQDFSGGTNWLIRLRLIHPFAALCAGAFIVWLLFQGIFRRPGPQAGTKKARADRTLALWIVLLLAFQYALGVVDVLLLAPVWMQVLHLLAADLLWISLVVLAARICIRPLTAPS